MTQNQPDAPEPQPTQPTPATPPSATPTESQPSVEPSVKPADRLEPNPGLAATGQKLQQLWEQVRPVLQVQSIRVLRVTILGLTNLLQRVEASTPEVPPANEAVWLQQVNERLQPVRTLWQKLITQVRQWLPETWNQRLTDTGLSAALITAAVVLFWILSSLLSPGQPPATAKQPSTNRRPPVAVAPSPVPKLKAPASPEPVPVELPPAVPQPVVTPAVKPTPAPLAAKSPEVTLDPNQVLQAAIEATVTEVASRFGNDLVNTVQPNLPQGQLQIQLSDRWYSLKPAQQDKLGAALLEKSQTLKLNQLQIKDAQGQLIARNAVVGPNLVILQRVSS